MVDQHPVDTADFAFVKINIMPFGTRWSVAYFHDALGRGYLIEG